MHETAHIIIGHDPARVDVTEDGLLILSSHNKQQEEAKWLSGCLLLPREALLLIRRQRVEQRRWRGRTASAARCSPSDRES
jgi:hypothetical protein